MTQVEAPPDEAPSEAARAVGRGIRWAVLGFGIGSLIAALAVALYTAAVATRSACADSACTRITHLATTLAWVVVAGSAVVLIGLAGTSRTRGPVRVAGRWAVRVAAAASGAALWAGYWWSDFPARRSEAAGYLPVSMQMWTLPPAVCLGVLGSLGVAVALSPGVRRPDRLGAVGIIVGVVITAGIAVTLMGPALPKGRDSTYLDATTAAPAPVPATPARLGPQRFAKQLDGSAWNRPFESAGAGYVVLQPYHDTSTLAVVAYDAVGHERWHFRRAGPGRTRVTDMAVYDHGRVVVAAIEAPNTMLVGLDALTGAQLWTSSDPTVRAAFGTHDKGRSLFLVARDDQHWTAFNAHTGQQSWQIPDPAHCGPGAREPLDQLRMRGEPKLRWRVDTDTRLATVVDCSTAQQVNLRLFAVDPTTGAVVTDRPVDIANGFTRRDIRAWMASPVGQLGVAVQFALRDAPGWALVYLNYDTGRQVDLGKDEPEYTVTSGDFLTRSAADGVTVTVRAPDGSPRCTFRLPGRYGVPLAFLSDEILMWDVPKPQQPVIHAFDRTTCQELGRQPTPLLPGQRFEFLRVVAGATLMVLTDESHQTAIVGYGA
ncbi:outer membrane protein assembly factor BamB family protein [Mycobacterium branderi]|uniref:Pyrrolo-quinoline quinone repeat domain-containing protein n=1 Tax=Mycobacterium branderi TaxID=43348 RepID=A0A7I7WCS5_9MYCO|nr:PQQ-binding-like beta-propeller repeat protein [Mycobacterium branderi]MCV7236375.1 PQQ-binding-like beta-propeller repeat protein [Mycobacterium branderi]ORA32555.1 hypothetical protein BST20_24425 [Mycobacterium branderi]BBZ15264.1 hypothetical protein MBRA_54590 [Mycobacterium branderi]